MNGYHRAASFSVGTFAKDSNSGKFDLIQPARIGSTVLQPGHSKAEWSGSDNALNIAIVNHGKTVATAHGHWKEMPNRSPYHAVSTHPGRDHGQQVDENDFSHRSQALIFAGHNRLLERKADPGIGPPSCFSRTTSPPGSPSCRARRSSSRSVCLRSRI